MVYAPGPRGDLKFAAVDQVVPAEARDAEGRAELPALFGQRCHLNEALGVCVLQAWIWKNNSSRAPGGACSPLASLLE